VVLQVGRLGVGITTTPRETIRGHGGDQDSHRVVAPVEEEEEEEEEKKKKKKKKKKKC
jgi:hypothetical protein